MAAPVETDPLRLRILKALTAHLEGTGVGEPRFGLPEGLTGKVFRGRAIFGEDDPLPMLCILETPIPLDPLRVPPDATLSAGTWELMIQGFAEDDKDNPTDPAHVLMAAVKKRLAQLKDQNRQFPGKGPQILGMGKAITDVKIGAGVVRPADEVSAKAYFWLNFSLDVTENLVDPFESGQ